MDKKPKSSPFDIKESQLKGEFRTFDELGRYLCEEVETAKDAASHRDALLDYWHRIYEQDRTRLVNNRPKPDGADLTSPLGTQYVDSLHARTMQTLFVEPIWTVEGWVDSVQKAPFVEEFHQWTAEDERLQNYCDRAISNAWIDGVGILECFEETDVRPVRKSIWAQIETVPDELGQPRAVFDEKLKPKFVMQDGKYAEVPPPQDGQPMPTGVAQLDIDSYEPVRVGPGYTVIDYRDFWTLPGHARDRRDIWGYAKRFHRRYVYLKQKAAEGLYDDKACQAIGDESDREQTQEDSRIGLIVARQEGPTAEKELHEIAFLLDLDGTGERWWVATVHVAKRVLLRLVYDELGTQVGFGRFVRFVPLPRKNSVDGFSVIGHKLITQIEEHTAIRNMRADRTALAGGHTLKVQQNALYDPEENPLGPGSVIYCRDMNEVQTLDFPDVPPSVNLWAQEVLDGAERTMGVNEIASGIQPSQDRTLGEVQLTAGYSEVRMNLVTKRLQEAMEELGQIRHAIWQRVLREQGTMEVPQRAMFGLEARGVDVSLIKGGTMTADLLEGKFRFKPRGSVETADLGKLRSDFVQMMQALQGVFAMNPMAAAAWQSPQAARAFNEQIVNLFRFPDRQAILGMPGQQAGQTSGLLADPRIQQMLQAAGMGQPGQPGQLPAPGGQQPPAPPMGGPQAPPAQAPPMGIM